MHAGAGGVEREFADGNAHAERAEIAQAEDSFAIGHDDQPHAFAGPEAEDFRDASALAEREEQPAQLGGRSRRIAGMLRRPSAYR